MAYTIIDNCTGCSACESRCPTAAIHGVKKELYYIDAALCIDCGACGVVCPDDAILDTFGRLTQQVKAQQRPKAFVELEKCTGCVYCVNACPFDCIQMEPSPPALSGIGIAAKVAVVEMRKCTGCTVCELDCPYDAIHIFRQDDPRAKEIVQRSSELWSSSEKPQAA
jgi:formate hydrogenlyase subunit 6/NADH:ubiquinone oxidoreductase subunit I